MLYFLKFSKLFEQGILTALLKSAKVLFKFEK